MKKTVLLYLTVSFLINQSSFSQNAELISSITGSEKANSYKPLISFSFRGHFDMPVTQSTLRSASLLSDFIKDYPVNWIENYESVDLAVSENGKSIHAKGTSASLTSDQKKLLYNINLNSTLEVTVNYHRKNTVSGSTDLHTLYLKMSVIPETEAQFPHGETSRNGFIKKNVVDKIEVEMIPLLRNSKVQFTVDETGKVVNVKMITSAGDAKTDRIIIRAFYQMPAWVPALNEDKTTVSQQFEFALGQGGC